MTRLIFILLTALSPALVSAQANDSLSRSLGRIGIGSTVRITVDANGSRGHFFGVHGESLLLEDYGATQSIPLRDIDEVARQGSYAKHGAITGAIIGGVTLGALGALAVSATCEDTNTHCRGDYPIVAAYGFALGGAGGGLVGGLIGFAIKRWVRVY